MPNWWKRPEAICSYVLLVSFVLPWGQFLGFGASGYRITTFGSYGNLAWLIPLAALGALASLQYLPPGQGSVVRLACGLVPLLALMVGLFQVGSAIFHGLAIGAYLALLSGFGLILAALFSPGEEAVGGHSGQPRSARSS